MYILSGCLQAFNYEGLASKNSNSGRLICPSMLTGQLVILVMSEHTVCSYRPLRQVLKFFFARSMFSIGYHKFLARLISLMVLKDLTRRIWGDYVSQPLRCSCSLCTNLKVGLWLCKSINFQTILLQLNGVTNFQWKLTHFWIFFYK